MIQIAQVRKRLAFYARTHRPADHKHGTYVGVKFSPATNRALVRFVRENRIPEPLPIDDFHTTVIYSKQPIPEFRALGDLSEPVKVPKAGRGFDLFGKEKNTLVITFSSSFLLRRFKAARAFGGTTDYPQYRPHITLSYSVPNDYDVNLLPIYDGPIEIISEYSDPLDPDWAK